MASVPAPAAIRKPQLSRRYQTSAEALGSEKPIDLVVVHLPQGHVDGKPDGISGPKALRGQVREDGSLVGFRGARRRDARSRPRLPARARDRRWRVVGEQAGRGGLHVGRVGRQEHVVPQAEQAQVAPVARVVLLAVEDLRVRRGGGIGPAREVLQVGDALLLVHDQVEDQVQVFGFRLAPQALGARRGSGRRSSCGRACPRCATRGRAGRRSARGPARRSWSRPPSPPPRGAAARTRGRGSLPPRPSPRARRRCCGRRVWKYEDSNGRSARSKLSSAWRSASSGA